MCGIVGYIGKRNAVDVILDGLTRLEYRGYDSAGIAIPVGNSGAKIVRAVGKLDNLKDAVKPLNLSSHMGIGHTRWATHGRPSEANAHPHRSDNIILVHNGIIENYRELKTDLERKGFVFLSDTDTEVLAHLIKSLFTKDLLTAVREAASKVRGSYALAVIDVNNPDILVVTKKDAPLVIGVSLDTEEFIAASDIPAALSVTRDFIMLAEGAFACLTSKGVSCFDASGLPIKREITHISWDAKAAEKDGYPAFMLKEIYEQPRTIQDTLRGKIIPDEGKIFLGELDGLETEKISRLIIVACGTSLNAATVGKLYIEKYAKVPVEVDIASEFLQRGLSYENGELVMVISQSGETADTKSALRAARKKGAKVAAICNVVGSAIALEADYCVYTHAGPEVSVASTKAFTAQTVTLLLFALWLAEKRGRIKNEDITAVLKELLHIPEKLKTTFKQAETIKRIAEKYIYAKSLLFLARHYNYPIAYEGALKLKELSYIHAEGYAAGEMKHGPIALLDDKFPVIVLAPDGLVKEKVFSSIQEVTARGAQVIAVITEGAEPPAVSSDVITIPPCPEELSVLLTVAVAQLFAYYAATALERDVDKPRNLAKSVTVE